MFRSLIIIAAIALVYLLVKNRLQQRQSNKKRESISSQTVQCIQCETYLPDNEAISADDQYFCCKQHMRDWQKDQNKS